ncbi:maltose/maltodextrin transport permease-like protein, partial [bacterium]
DIGIARIPKISKTGLWPTPMFSPKGYSVNKNVKPEVLPEVIKLIEYLTSPKVELQFTKALGTIPSVLPAQHDSLVKNDPLIMQSKYQLDVCRPMPVVPELRAIWDALRPAYQSVLGGTMTPEQAAKSAQKDAEKKIKEMYE